MNEQVTGAQTQTAGNTSESTHKHTHVCKSDSMIHHRNETSRRQDSLPFRHPSLPILVCIRIRFSSCSVSFHRPRPPPHLRPRTPFPEFAFPATSYKSLFTCVSANQVSGKTRSQSDSAIPRAHDGSRCSLNQPPCSTKSRYYW